jgi:hypothetical protein
VCAWGPGDRVSIGRIIVITSLFIIFHVFKTFPLCAEKVAPPKKVTIRVFASELYPGTVS